MPDQFGHVGQMPQILRHGGVERAVVWRGVPASIDRDAFWWESPDGSRVLTEYMAFGYFNGASFEKATGPEELAEALTGAVERQRPFMASDRVLVMVGYDHAGTGSVPGGAPRRRGQDPRRDPTRHRRHGRPPGCSGDHDGSPTWRGELRSSARAHLLPNVYSARVHQKRERGSDRVAGRALRGAVGRARPRVRMAGRRAGPRVDPAAVERRARLVVRLLARPGGAGRGRTLRGGSGDVRGHRRRRARVARRSGRARRVRSASTRPRSSGMACPGLGWAVGAADEPHARAGRAPRGRRRRDPRRRPRAGPARRAGRRRPLQLLLRRGGPGPVGTGGDPAWRATMFARGSTTRSRSGCASPAERTSRSSASRARSATAAPTIGCGSTWCSRIRRPPRSPARRSSWSSGRSSRRAATSRRRRRHGRHEASRWRRTRP